AREQWPGLGRCAQGSRRDRVHRRYLVAVRNGFEFCQSLECRLGDLWIKLAGLKDPMAQANGFAILMDDSIVSPAVHYRRHLKSHGVAADVHDCEMLSHYLSLHITKTTNSLITI